MPATNDYPEFLVTTDWLADHLDDPTVRVLDPSTLLPPRPDFTRYDVVPATQQALETAAQHLAAAGAEVRDLELPAAFTNLVAAQETIQVFEGMRCCAHELTRHRDQLSPKLIETLAPGVSLPYAAYADAMALAETCRRRLETVFTDHDVLLVPSAPGEAPVGLEATGDPIFNRMWTLLHVPALNLPGFITAPGGLPVGVQVIGPIGTDDRLLSIATWMHRRLS